MQPTAWQSRRNVLGACLIFGFVEACLFLLVVTQIQTHQWVLATLAVIAWLFLPVRLVLDIRRDLRAAAAAFRAEVEAKFHEAHDPSITEIRWRWRWFWSRRFPFRWREQVCHITMHWPDPPQGDPDAAR